MKITALAGGVGGAKLAHGFKEILSPKDFTVVVNTGDDFWHFGLYICPDLDTVMYNLAGISNPVTGWGIKNDTYQTMDALEKLGGPRWFQLGDKDFATHLERTRRIRKGESLSHVTKDISRKLGVEHKILPMTDSYVPTYVNTIEFGVIPFQDYFVKYHFSPKIKDFVFKDIEKAKPTREVIKNIIESDAVVVCPSNPFVSIDPILALEEIKEILFRKYVVCVSPIVDGKALKGPLAKMFTELEIDPNPINVAKHYYDFLNVIFIDHKDHKYQQAINHSSIICVESDIIMPNLKERIRLANEIINYLHNI